MAECVYFCRHPVWGGAGACVENNDGVGLGENVGGDHFCLCEDGFVSRDFTGAASCVSRGAQLTILSASTVIHLASSVFLAWHAARHSKLPAPIRSSRRGTLRLRLSVATSLASAWLALVCIFGVVRARTGHLVNTGILPVLLIIACPVCAPSCIFAIDLWVDSLPSQVLAADSLEARLKQLAADKDFFAWVAVIYTGFLAIADGIMLGVLDVRTVWTVSDTIVAFNATSTGSCILFIGVRISRVIGRAEAQARLESKPFYHRARKKLWTQVVALSGACTIFSTIVGVKELLPEARRTPIMPAMLYMLVTSMAFVMTVHFSRPNLAAVRAPPAPAVAYTDLPPRSGETREGTREGGGGRAGFVRDTIRGFASSQKPAGKISGVMLGREARVTPSSTP